MRRSPTPSPPARAARAEEAPPSGPATVDLGLALSVYGKHEDGSLFELGNPASPLARQSAAGTWPTEQ